MRFCKDQNFPPLTILSPYINDNMFNGFRAYESEI